MRYGFNVWYEEEDVVLDNESMPDPTDFLIKLRISNTVELRCPPHLLGSEGEEQGHAPVYGESIKLDPIEDSFCVPCNQLITEEDLDMTNTGKFLTPILSELGVPARLRPIIIGNFYACARWMRHDARFARCSVLSIILEIKITSMFQLNETAPDTWDLTPDKQVPASESSIENLGRVRLVRGPEECVICLETIPVGSFVSAMPCLHVYHRSCIVKWLQKKHLCPVCRFPMPR